MGLRFLAPRQLRFPLLLGVKVFGGGLVTFLAALTEVPFVNAGVRRPGKQVGTKMRGSAFLQLHPKLGPPEQCT